MTTVNVWHIGNLLGALTGAADEERIAAIPEDDKASLRELFADRLAPAYQRLRPHGQNLFKESLRYFLNARSATVGDMIAAMQDVPLSSEDPYPMLEALWEAVFPGEDYRLADTSEYVENNDDATGNEIFAPDGGWP
jgi:hypothetical protein